jgi:hypothetical protein
MTIKRLSVLILLTGLVTASAFAQSVQPRKGTYAYEDSSSRHAIIIMNAIDSNGRTDIFITSTSLGEISIEGAYWRSGSGALEFVYNGRTVQIRAVSGGRGITCTLFSGKTFWRE